MTNRSFYDGSINWFGVFFAVIYSFYFENSRRLAVLMYNGFHQESKASDSRLEILCKEISAALSQTFLCRLENLQQASGELQKSRGSV